MSGKKFAAVSLSLLLAVGMFAGCSQTPAGKSSSAPQSSAAESKGSAAAPVTLEFFQQKTQAGPQKGYQRIIDAFKKECPEITIEMNTVPDAGKVLTTRISSGDIPPLFSDYPTQLQFKQKVANGYLEKLSGQAFLSRVNPASIAMSKANDGETYALPLSSNFMGIYYNADTFKKYGFQVPETYDELIAICDKLVADGKTPFVQSLKDRTGHLFQSLLIAWTQNGVETIKKVSDGKGSVSDDPEMRKLAERMINFSKYFNKDAFGIDLINMGQEFANGNYPMSITGSYDYGTLKIANPNINMGIFPIPNDTKKTSHILTGIDAALCISGKATAAEKAAALKFLEFVSRTENAQMFCDEDGAPSCITAVAFKDTLQQPVISMIKSGQVHDWMASTVNGKVVNELYNVTQGFFMDKNVDKYLKDMDETIKVASAQ